MAYLNNNGVDHQFFKQRKVMLNNDNSQRRHSRKFYKLDTCTTGSSSSARLLIDQDHSQSIIEDTVNIQFRMPSNVYSFFDEHIKMEIPNKLSIYKRCALKTCIVLTSILWAFLLIFFVLEITTPKCQPCIARWFAHENPTKETTCTTAGCVRAAADLLQSIDFSKDPCHNFFDFACGTWVKNTRIPDDKPRINNFAKADDVIKEKFRTMFEESESVQTNSRAINYAFEIYRKCMNITALNAIKAKPLLAYLDKIGGWPIISSNWSSNNIDFTDLIAVTFTEMSSQALLNWGTDADAKNVTNNILAFDQTSLGLGFATRDYYLNDTAYKKQMDAYKQFIRDVARTLASDAGRPAVEEKRFDDDIDKMVDFERRVAAIVKPEDERRNSSLMYNKRTLAQFGDSLKFFNIPKLLKKILPDEIFQRLIEGHENYEIIVREPAFFDQYQTILQQTDKRILVNFVGWFIVKDLLDRLDSRYEDIHQDFQRVFRGRLQKPPRWKTCVETASSLDKATGALYVRQHFSPADKKSASQMINNLRRSFKELLNQNEWMDRETKIVAQEKLEYIVELIGYPSYAYNDTGLDEYYANLTINKEDSFFDSLSKVSKWDVNRDLFELLKHQDRQRFIADPAAVNAFYSGEKNSIIFPAGILQRPFFHSTYPEYVNYGAMGSVIGHELTHGFDDQGRQTDKLGNLVDWWTKSAEEKFVTKTKCIVDQYSSFVVKEVNKTVNGNLTQGENIADNGGVKQSFRAYQKYVADRGSPEAILPGMNLTAEQLFFASYAQFWCGKMKPETRLLYLLTDSHSPELFRVNGPLSNLEAFAQVFKCPSGSPMNPVKRCSVW